MRINYAGHDDVYRARRAAGQPGWDTAEGVRETLTRLEAFLTPVAFSAHPSLVELGCGAGDLALHFATKGWTVHGLDISRFAVAWAKEKAATAGLAATFEVADLTRPFGASAAPADLVLDGHCLHCIIGSDRGVFLDNARRLLAPGSLLCIDTMCGDPSNALMREQFDPASRCLVARGIAARYLGRPDDILGELDAAGLRILRHEHQPADGCDDQDMLIVLAEAVTVD